MSSRLRELIRSVRQCKTAAQERNVVAKESAALREAFKKQDTAYQHRNVAKLMYIHMLGYPTHFGQMECLKLIAAPSFPEKRVGYLGLMILLDERQEVLMLVTNSLKNDLSSKNQYNVGLALAAFGNICSAEMARDLAPDVEKLLKSSNSYIRKKAALTTTRIVKKVPELVEQFMHPAAELLNDRHHGALLTGVTLMLEMCHLEPDAIKEYRNHIPQLCRIMRSLVVSGFSPEHDVGGINDPFLQVKILRLLRVLGKGNAEASDQMSDILAQAATNTEPTKNAGNSILYECVQTIMSIESTGGLRVLAVNILGRFLGNKDNNLRYVALNTLAKVVTVDAQAVQRHRTTIVDCVRDADVSIRRRALELVYSLVNEGNIKNLTKELLEYLAVSDAEFKPDLTSKICTLIQRYGPDKCWHIDNMLQVMAQAGQYVKEDVCNALIVLITNATDLQGYTVRAMFRAMKANGDSSCTSLLTVSAWCLGEYGDLLLPGRGGALQQGEEALSVSDSEIVDLLEANLSDSLAEVEVREYVLTALMKLSAKLPGQVERIKGIVGQYTGNLVLEMQQRACEYKKLFNYDQIRPQLLEQMPALNEKEYAANLGLEVTASDAKQAAEDSNLPNGAPPQPAQVDLLSDLLGDQPATVQARGGLEALLFDPSPASTQAPAAGAATGAAPQTSSAAVDLLDLLSDSTPSPAQPERPAVMQDPFLALDASPGPSATAAPGGAAFPSIVAVEKHGFKVSFSFSKPSATSPATDIVATYSNSTPNPITNFSLQAAVPKYMHLKLESASGTSLPPNGNGTVTQVIHVSNSMRDQGKPLAMRLKISANVGGSQVDDQCQVNNFPPGLS